MPPNAIVNWQQHTKEDLVPLIYYAKPGEGVRIDVTDIWTVKSISADGISAVIMRPDGSLVTLAEDPPHRIAPGLRLSVMPGRHPGEIALVVDAFIPLIHRHPPRDNRPRRQPEDAR